MKDLDLRQTMDAAVWAKDFWERFGNNKDQIDESLMLTWFANAIMCGWDHAHWKLEPRLKEYEVKVRAVEDKMKSLESTESFLKAIGKMFNSAGGGENG
jgi:hypothetical protein